MGEEEVTSQGFEQRSIMTGYTLICTGTILWGDKMEMQKWNSEEGARLLLVGEIMEQKPKTKLQRKINLFLFTFGHA